MSLLVVSPGLVVVVGLRILHSQRMTVERCNGMAAEPKCTLRCKMLLVQTMQQMVAIGQRELEQFLTDIYKVLSSHQHPLKDKVSLVLSTCAFCIHVMEGQHSSKRRERQAHTYSMQLSRSLQQHRADCLLSAQANR